MYQYQKKFENILGKKINNHMFKILYQNAKYESYLNKIDLDSWDYFLSLNLETDGSFINATNYLYSELSEQKIEPSEEYFININKKLNENGYIILDNFLDNETIKKINNEIKLHKHISKTDKNKIIQGDFIDCSSLNEFYAGPFYSYLKDKEFQEDSEIIQRLVLNNQIKMIVENYFKSTPYLVGLTSMITNPKKIENFNDLDIHFNAQMFHFDYSHLKFLKVFVFLSDVESEEDGAHCFVEGSHKPYRKYPKEKIFFLDQGLRQLGPNYFGNIKKEWIENNYEQKKIKKFYLPKGSILIEDTFGFHRGMPCLRNQRKVLQLYFAISNLSAGWSMRCQSTLAINSNEKYLYPMLLSKKKIHNQIERFYKRGKLIKFINFLTRKFKM